MDLFTTNRICVTVCLHLDWRDRGPVFHLWGWMVRYRWSFQNLLHQNMQRLGGAEADGVFAGGRHANIRLTSQHDLTLRIFLSLPSLLIDQIVLPHDYPSTSPPIYQIKWVYLPLKLNQAVMCQTDKSTSHSNTYSTSCSVIPFVSGLCSAAWLRGPERAKLANSLEDLYVWVHLVNSDWWGDSCSHTCYCFTNFTSLGCVLFLFSQGAHRGVHPLSVGGKSPRIPRWDIPKCRNWWAVGKLIEGADLAFHLDCHL